MKTYRHEVNGVWFQFSVEEPLYPQAQILLSAMKTIPSEKWKHGFKMQVGFSVYILKEIEEGYQIVVPDCTQNPFSDTTGDLTVDLWIQLEQTDFLRYYQLHGEAVRFDDKVVVAKNALQKTHICLQRFPDLGESGWCIEAIETRQDGSFCTVEAEVYETFYAYQLLKIRPALMKALVLPYEYVVIFKGDDIVEVLNEQNDSLGHIKVIRYHNLMERGRICL